MLGVPLDNIRNYESNTHINIGSRYYGQGWYLITPQTVRFIFKVYLIPRITQLTLALLHLDSLLRFWPPPSLAKLVIRLFFFPPFLRTDGSKSPNKGSKAPSGLLNPAQVVTKCPALLALCPLAPALRPSPPLAETATLHVAGAQAQMTSRLPSVKGMLIWSRP